MFDSLTEKFYVEVYRVSSLIDPNDELDWFALTVGWGLARGLATDQAHAFASHIQYDTPYG